MIFIKNNIKNNYNEQGTEFESIFFNKSMKSSEFYECLNHYQHINIEVEYPTKSFKLILDLVIKICKKNHNKPNIGLIFTSFRKLLKKECFSKEISYYRIDSSINSIPLETFKECSSLTQITIPSSVTQIGDFAFYDQFNIDDSHNIKYIDIINCISNFLLPWNIRFVLNELLAQIGTYISKYKIPTNKTEEDLFKRSFNVADQIVTPVYFEREAFKEDRLPKKILINCLFANSMK